VRFDEITHGGEPHAAHELRDDRSGLEYLLAHSVAGSAPLTDAELCEAFGEDKRLAITDALGRLHGDGLIERRGWRVIASEVARRFDELMKL
jgi:DNA-binding GntR family transcriptional regulator